MQLVFVVTPKTPFLKTSKLTAPCFVATEAGSDPYSVHKVSETRHTAQICDVSQDKLVGQWRIVNSCLAGTELDSGPYSMHKVVCDVTQDTFLKTSRLTAPCLVNTEPELITCSVHKASEARRAEQHDWQPEHL